jgi:AmmeMemoRadiSam system protein B
LHLPFLVAAMRGRPFTLVPIVVGALDAPAERAYGRLLAPYLTDPGNFFVVSTDFCHWGDRFAFAPVEAPPPGAPRRPIHAQIAELDREGMAAIEAVDAAAFAGYLRRTGNTICGRHPIGVLLAALEAAAAGGAPHAVRFVRYDQSARVASARQSSVSYAAAVVTAVGP